MQPGPGRLVNVQVAELKQQCGGPSQHTISGNAESSFRRSWGPDVMTCQTQLPCTHHNGGDNDVARLGLAEERADPQRGRVVEIYEP